MSIRTNKKRVIKMLDPKETTRVEENKLIKRVIDGDNEALMVFNDLGLRHIVDVTQKYSPKNINDALKLLRVGFVGYYKALKLYLENKNFKKHKFTNYSEYFILKEIEEYLAFSN